MPASSSRRPLILGLLLATVGGFWLLSHWAPKTAPTIELASAITATASETPVLSAAEIIPTETPTTESTPVHVVAATPTETAVPMVDVATDADVIDIKKLRSTDVSIKVHQIVMGENYWTLAKQADIDIYTLIGANPTLPFKASTKQIIYILSKKGTLHTVHSSDSLLKLAEKYRTTEKVIQETNGLHWWHPMRAGDVLFIPDARPVLMIEQWKDYFSKRGIFGVPFSRWATWTSGFGLRIDPFTGKHKEHTGVDLRAKYGDPVYASAPGRVIFAGVAGGYGNLIQIAHSHGYVTYYGHLSKIYAHVGAKVRRGTVIGRVGATGHVTGPHLHFEIRLKGKPLDPLQFI